MGGNELVSLIVIGIGGPVGVGSIFLWLVRGLVSKIEKIQPLEQRVALLEVEQIKHNKNGDELIRLQEHVKFLSQQVQRLIDKLESRNV